MKTTRVLRGVGAAGLALALSACIKMDMQMEINADDTVDGSIVMAFSKDFMDMADMMGEDADMDSLFEDFMDFDPEEEGIPEYASVESYEDDDYVGQQMNFDGVPLSEFEGGEEFDGMSIVREGEEFVFRGDMDMTDTGSEDLGEMPPGMLENMDFDMRVSITFPGEVLEHNGELDGTTVTWQPRIGDTNDMFARSSDSGGAGGGVPVWLWIVIGIVVLAGLIGLLFLLSRNKKETAPAAEADSVPATAGAAPPPPADAAPPAAPPAAPAAPPEQSGQQPGSPDQR